MAVSQMIPTARRIVVDLLAVAPGERVCIVTDHERPREVTEALLSVIEYVGAEGVVVTMPPRDMGGVDPPPAVGAAMKASDVAIMQLSFSTVHTRTVREALAAGTRICELWGVTTDMMVRGGLTEDPAWVQRVTEEVSALLTNGRTLEMTTPDGSWLKVSLEGRSAISLAAGATRPGQFCSLPLGEAAIAPVEGTAEGVMTGPYLVEHRDIARPREPLTLRIEKGLVTAVEGGVEARRLAALLDQHGPTARNIAEVAVGTNRRSRVDVGLREAKKAWGTAHFAVGDSQSIGGTVESPLHIDFIFREPTVTVDGQCVVKDGRLLIA
ncbi:MAG TPA: hypothetical protein VIK93_06655 [Limnochordales bacterium]